MTQPNRSTFWRFILLVTFLFAVLAGWDLINLAQRWHIQILSRSTWLIAIVCLGIFAGSVLIGLMASFFSSQIGLWNFLESPITSTWFPRQVGMVITLVALAGFSIVTSLADFKRIISAEDWARVFIFWSFSLLGMWGIKTLRKEIPWLIALITAALSQATLQLLLAYWSQVTTYPFAMSWSETSRFYYPSLFLSKIIYGQGSALPILHPTLHLLLVPPYLFHAPLWVHRFWQVAIRYLLIAAVVPAILRRIPIQAKGTRWLMSLWMFLFLFMGPIYYHLTIPVILILIGFSLHDDRQNWFVILFASAWCGWSRVNWYPVPAMLAVVLYTLEMPIKGKSFWQYLLKPAMWGIVGVLTAFAFQQIYIAVSGVAATQEFYTSISSALLWYRLFPNATYANGILPGATLASFAIWVSIYLVIRTNRNSIHPIRIVLLLVMLAVLFIGGIFVSLKIGGGGDLHNLDAYFVALLIVFAYLVFAKYITEDNVRAQPVQVPWLVVVAMLVVPVWSQIQSNIGFVTYDAQRTNAVLANLQRHVDQVNAQGGEILFITQRQLISMDMLHGITLIPEYEREDLMEMAMADNIEYLEKFRSDLENQRFALIVVDPLHFIKISRKRSFAEENNVWAARVAKSILCNYHPETIFPEDDIALYVPQVGERQCP